MKGCRCFIMKKILYTLLIISVMLGAAYGIKTANQAAEANKAAIAATQKAEAEAAAKAKAELEAKTKAEADAAAKAEAEAKAKTEEEAEAKAKAEAEAAAKAKASSGTAAAQKAAAGTSNTGGGKTIVIDPGHASTSSSKTEPNAPGSSVMKAMESGGATGSFTGTPEYQINMNVAKKLKPLLEAKGYRVVMTKTDNSTMLGNVARAQIGNDQNAALVIRIHCDSTDGSSTNGASMLVPAKVNAGTTAIADISYQYGKTILNTLTSEVGMKNNGVVTRSDMTGFNWTKVPVVLVEMGFLSNQTEDNRLSSDSYQNQLAAALAKGIALAVK
jgi:N-acetylmuramoyl-L-alanine amidase